MSNAELPHASWLLSVGKARLCPGARGTGAALAHGAGLLVPGSLTVFLAGR